MDPTLLALFGAILGVIVFGALLIGLVLWSTRVITRSARAPNPDAPGATALPATLAMPAVQGTPSNERASGMATYAVRHAVRPGREHDMPYTGTFATVINCIDGRAQRPVADWVRVNAQATFVDTATIPGPDKVLTQGPLDRIALLREEVEVSPRAHGSRFVAIAGHHECAANPVSAEEHKRMIRAAVEVIRGWSLRDAEGRPAQVRVVGLWVNDSWLVEVVADSGA